MRSSLCVCCQQAAISHKLESNGAQKELESNIKTCISGPWGQHHIGQHSLRPNHDMTGMRR
eukprot:3254467-Amphidinium_carterae.1